MRVNNQNSESPTLFMIWSSGAVLMTRSEQWSYIGCQTSNSASSSKFHHLALLALFVVLVSCSSNFHNWPLLALCGTIVALGWISGFNFCHPIVRSLVLSQYHDVAALSDLSTDLYTNNTNLTNKPHQLLPPTGCPQTKYSKQNYQKYWDYFCRHSVDSRTRLFDC